MQIGIDSFVASPAGKDPEDGTSLSRRMAEFLEQIRLADSVGVDVIGIGEHHRPDFIASSPAVLLAAIAATTKTIRLSSAVTVLGSEDPVRVFQQFATLDLISQGRAEIIAGRGSFIESFPLFGFDLDDYDAVFAEKLDLLLKIRERNGLHWSGQFRPALHGEAIHPRPMQKKLPIRLGVGGTPQSFVRAGMLGLPLVVAIIGGEPHRFRPLIDLYRKAWEKAGHPKEEMWVGIHSIGFAADTDDRAAETFFPHYHALFSRIGQERGWPPVTRAQYDAMISPLGALFVGSPETLAAKIRHVDDSLGGIDRITILMDSGMIPHEAMMRSTELLGSKIAPLVKVPELVH